MPSIKRVMMGAAGGGPAYKLYSFGGGGQGQQNNSSTDNKSVPTQVGALTNWSAAFATQYATAGITTDYSKVSGSLVTTKERDRTKTNFMEVKGIENKIQLKHLIQARYSTHLKHVKYYGIL